jgi:hypothetical protein
MPTLAATVLLRRREGKRQTGAGMKRILAQRASRLGVASQPLLLGCTLAIGAGVGRGSTSTTCCGVELRLDNYGSLNCALT